MNRKTLAIIAGAIILSAVILSLFWPDGAQEAEPVETASEAELPEGLVLLDEQQIRAAKISVEAVGRGSAVELVFPATIAASPTGSARIDARAAGVVRSVNKTLGDYVRAGETVARIESADAAALA